MLLSRQKQKGEEGEEKRLNIVFDGRVKWAKKKAVFLRFLIKVNLNFLITFSS
jgi:hypothetical protein